MEDPKAPFRKKGRLHRFTDAESREAGAHVALHLRALKEWTAASFIGVYCSLPWEMSLGCLFESGLERFAFPKVEGDRMRFFKITQQSDLVRGYGGIPEPRSGEPVVWSEKDLLLIPGAMFDAQGGRVGSGRGYYDRFLATLKSSPLKIGVCWAAQLSSQPLPQNSNDVRMDAVCTERGLIWTREKA